MNPADFTYLKVAFKTIHGSYLRADSGIVVNTAQSIREWEIWTIIPLDKSEYAIRSFHDKYLCARGRNEGDVLDQSTILGHWERFKLIHLRDGLWSIQSVAHGSYIRTHVSGKVDIQRAIDTWEKYGIVILSEPEIVKNLTYKFNEKEALSEKPMTISTITHTNNHDKPSNFKHTFKEELSKSFKFTQNYGVKIKAKTKLFAGIPVISRGNLEISNEEELDWTSGSDITTTSSVQIEANTDVNPGESVKCSLTAIGHQMNIPWTATAIYKVYNKEFVKNISGMWKGTIITNIGINTDKL